MSKIEKGELARVICDVIKSDWSFDMKKNILVKQMLWSRYRPRTYQNKDLPPDPIWFSRGAKKIYLKNVKNGAATASERAKGLIQEHLVPRTIIFNELLKIKRITPKKVDDLLGELLIIVLVTKDEDRKLDKIGLRSKMPEGWCYGDDPFQRHEAAGIVKVDWIPEILAERYSEHEIEY
ncbi:hypothetical protein K6Y31_21655 [Motilimonas cestriensis]|uniref:Uncharacterized protein n=1 Tax=Motilimonas cestriensis TaxID=2742685 RepID=A0ABS8WJ48_9GAMM|nr:hypothetical protein [Motilimonas cestriensis]MCE2597380.1 hypothetical protein [Motilimonas cestriensis]